MLLLYPIPYIASVIITIARRELSTAALFLFHYTLLYISSAVSAKNLYWTLVFLPPHIYIHTLFWRSLYSSSFSHALGLANFSQFLNVGTTCSNSNANALNAHAIGGLLRQLSCFIGRSDAWCERDLHAVASCLLISSSSLDCVLASLRSRAARCPDVKCSTTQLGAWLLHNLGTRQKSTRSRSISLRSSTLQNDG